MAKMTYLVLFLYIGLVASDEDSGTDAEEPSDAGSEDLNRLMNQITPSVLDDAFKSAESVLEARNRLERKLVESGRFIGRDDRRADTSLFRMEHSDRLIKAREELNIHFEEATEILIKSLNLTRDEVANVLPKLSLHSELHRSNSDACRQQPEDCDANSKYRTASGRCNNLDQPTWGIANACQRRMMTPSYVGQSGFRRSLFRDEPLPAARRLSLNLHFHLNRPTNDVTHMYIFFGQMLDHDIALTPVSTLVGNRPIQCCPDGPETHPECAPVLIGRDDPFYAEFGTTCLNFVRSAICDTCAMGFRQQINQVTSFIDGSLVYDNSEFDTRFLRVNNGTEKGHLRTQSGNRGDLLPKSANPDSDRCSIPETNDICFKAGDPRVNQHTMIAALQTILMREHNRLADDLSVVNPHWDDETVFQEARRILGAQLQMITYNEYLPITLGSKKMTHFKLWVSGSGTTVYNRHVDSTLLVEFSTAAFRFGHSMVNSMVASTPLNSTNGTRLLRNEFIQPFDLYSGVLGPLVRGASDSPAQSHDRHIVEDVTNHLYRRRGTPAGLDLAAFNINRGRDNGIPSYTDAVRHCTGGKTVVKKFRDLHKKKLMGKEEEKVLQRNYKNVGDIDLWPGILMEYQLPGAIVGQTAACIIGLQFRNMKFGDRFYFEHRDQAGSFTSEQLKELKRTTLSKLMCLNSDADQLLANAMKFASAQNPIIDCRHVRPIDLSHWKE